MRNDLLIVCEVAQDVRPQIVGHHSDVVVRMQGTEETDRRVLHIVDDVPRVRRKFEQHHRRDRRLRHAYRVHLLLDPILQHQKILRLQPRNKLMVLVENDVHIQSHNRHIDP